MDTRRTARVTAAERAAWAAAGALATLAALAGLAVHWGRAVERNEQYGTWQAQPERDDGMTPLERETARLDADEAELRRADSELSRRRAALARARSGRNDYPG